MVQSLEAGQRVARVKWEMLDKMKSNSEQTNTSIEVKKPKQINHREVLVDLILFLTVMFLVRTITIPGLGFMGNALFNSLVTLGVATWRLRVRGLSWKSLGVSRPKSFKKMIGVTVFILVLVPVSVIFVEIISDLLSSTASVDSTQASTDSRFENIKGNLSYFFSIIFLVWIESFFEELQDRGFLLNWLESLFSKIPFSTILAVVIQASIFGFRHAPSHGISGAITVGIIGLIFGIAYVAFGRNLWALIVAHCLLNSMSMLERL